MNATTAGTTPTRLNRWETILYAGGLFAAVMLAHAFASPAGNNWLNFVTLVTGVAVLGVVWYANVKTLRQESIRIGLALAATAVTIVLTAISATTLAVPFKGVYVDTTSGQSTLTHDFIHTAPFSLEVSYFFEDHNTNTSVDVQTRDGIPLACSVSTTGIRLDKRDPAELEQHLLAARSTWELDRQATAIVAQAAQTVLSEMTVGDMPKSSWFQYVTSPSRTSTGYTIGTLASPSLLEHGLHWENGGIRIWCDVRSLNN